jgi:tetratricopeptide (TPR) repeat protein
MLTEDYLIRMINLALAALASIVGLKTAGQYYEAFIEIDQALEQLLGLRADLVRRLDDASILNSLTTQGKLDVDRLWIVAELYKEEGDVFTSQNNPAQSYWSYLRSLNFYLTGFLEGGGKYLSEPQEKIKALVLILQGYELSPETRFSLFYFYEQTGEYQKAEETLIRLMAVPGVEDDIRLEMIDFYQRLLTKDETDLVNSGLTRAQLEEKLAKLQPGSSQV